MLYAVDNHGNGVIVPEAMPQRAAAWGRSLPLGHGPASGRNRIESGPSAGIGAGTGGALPLSAKR
jgi:hypothetical protein